jgi:hypothetical protein
MAATDDDGGQRIVLLLEGDEGAARTLARLINEASHARVASARAEQP